MTSNLDSDHYSDKQPGDLPLVNSYSDSHSQSVLNTMHQDQFELLSAYLDGEVTAAERRLVEEWLTTDPKVQRLHQRLLLLRSSFQGCPVPSPAKSPEQTAAAVFKRVERRPTLAVLMGGTAIAALAIAVTSSIFSGQSSLRPQLAQSSNGNFENLQIALNEPIVEMVNPNEVGITLNEPIIEIPKGP